MFKFWAPTRIFGQVPPLDRPPRCVSIVSVGKVATELGISIFNVTCPESVSEGELLTKVAELNADPKVHGILVQLLGRDHTAERVVVEVGGGLYYTQFHRSDNRAPINGNFPSIKGGRCPIYAHLFLGNL